MVLKQIGPKLLLGFFLFCFVRFFFFFQLIDTKELLHVEIWAFALSPVLHMHLVINQQGKRKKKIHG